jgi:CBS domain-containing protein
MSVGAYCERPARTVGADETVRSAAQRMETEGVGCLIVVEANQPRAIVTDRDVALEVLCDRPDPGSLRVGELKSGALVTVRDDAPLAEAGRLMHRHGVRRLPVVDDKGHLVGVIAADDLMRVVVGELSGLGAAVAVQAPRPQEGGQS